MECAEISLGKPYSVFSAISAVSMWILPISIEKIGEFPPSHQAQSGIEHTVPMLQGKAWTAGEGAPVGSQRWSGLASI
jgi:hypothetical protein